MDRVRFGPIANVRGGDGKAALGTSEKKPYPKESALIDPVAAERMEGRRVLVYATHTGARGITGRMDDILTRHEFRVTVMKFEAVAPAKRDASVEDQAGQAGASMSYRNTLQARLRAEAGLDLIETFESRWPPGETFRRTRSGGLRRRRDAICLTRPVKLVRMPIKRRTPWTKRTTVEAGGFTQLPRTREASAEGVPSGGRRLEAFSDGGSDRLTAPVRNGIRPRNAAKSVFRCSRSGPKPGICRHAAGGLRPAGRQHP